MEPTKIPDVLIKGEYKSFSVWYIRYSCDSDSIENLVGKADVDVFSYLIQIDIKLGMDRKQKYLLGFLLSSNEIMFFR